jgi:hypothetical protein
MIPVWALAGFEVPVDPDAAEARRWIIQELSKPAYQAAQPTWFDRVSSAFWDWLNSLDLSGTGAAGGPILVLAVILVLAAIVAGFFIFGPPRLNRRSGVAGPLFGEDDERTAAVLRAAAETAASRGDWSTALSEMFRSIARGLAERTIVSVNPGMTAHSLVQNAARAFPELAGALRDAAGRFDGVRYLGRVGTEDGYRLTAQLERALRNSRPALEPAGSPQ